MNDVSVRRPARAVVAHAFGPPSGFVLEARDPGDPGPGELRVAVRAAGVSFADVLVAAGRYQLRPPLPFVPGSEIAGVVESVGAEVDPSMVGTRVCGSVFGGAMAEAAVTKASAMTPIPSGMGFAEASVFLVSFTTAYHALVQRGRLEAGETLLVLGAAGAVGQAAVQLGRALGARVIASASSEAKRAAALAGGAERAIDSGSPAWRDDLKAACEGRPLDVVLDPVGGAATEPAFRSLGWGGRHLVIGFASGTIPKLPTNLALLKGADLIGVDIRQFTLHTPALAAANRDALLALQAAGHLRPMVGRIYPLARFADAMEAAGGGGPAGRVVVSMEDDGC